VSTSERDARRPRGRPPRAGSGSKLLATLLMLTACAEDLRLETPLSEAAVPVITEGDAATGFSTFIDASSQDLWIYFDFETGALATPGDPPLDEDWDLAFQRFHIISNGGDSGPGEVTVAALVGVELASVTSAPDAAYVSDQPDSDDTDEIADSAFAEGDGWYAYDPSTNRLSPRDIVYVVRTGSGAHYKLQMLGYYDVAGSSGHPSFSWFELPPEGAP
jgi:HmuY protein